MKYLLILIVAFLLVGCPNLWEREPDTLSEWQATSSLLIPRANHAAVAHNGFLYVFGGAAGDENWINHVEYAPVLADGTVGTWTVTTSMPYPARKLEAFVHDNNVYLVGGNGTNGAILDEVIYAPINADGSLGSWTETTSLSLSCYEFALVVENDTVVLLGGGFDRRQTVEYASINSDGSIGPWQSGPDLLQLRGRHAAVLHGGTIFLIGGDGGSFDYVLDVEYSSIDASGTPGPWTAGIALSSGWMLGDAAVFEDYIFALGRGTVQYVQMSDGSTEGVFEPGPIFTPRSSHTAVISGSQIYVIGGYSYADGLVGIVEYAMISSQ